MKPRTAKREKYVASMDAGGDALHQKALQVPSTWTHNVERILHAFFSTAVFYADVAHLLSLPSTRFGAVWRAN